MNLFMLNTFTVLTSGLNIL